jgi:hypothetical protein
MEKCDHEQEGFRLKGPGIMPLSILSFFHSDPRVSASIRGPFSAFGNP